MAEHHHRYYTVSVLRITLNLRCSICSMDVAEEEIENHVNGKQHIENKSKISVANGKGSDNSVVKMWRKSLQE